MMSSRPIEASKLAAMTSGMPCSIEAGIRCVPMRPLVLRPQMKKLPASNQKSRERSPSARPISGAAAAARGGRGVGGALGGSPNGRRPMSRGWSRISKATIGSTTRATPATGQLLFLPLLASMVVRLGWRSAVLLVAGVALVVLPLVALLMRDHPRDIGLRPFGEPPNAPPTPRPPRAAAAAPLIGLALGLRSRDFWLLAGSFVLCGLSTNGLIGTHLIPASMEHGIPEVMAASLLASIGLLDIIGTTVSGWLSDRWDNRSEEHT